jgi:hypothetical protein
MSTGTNQTNPKQLDSILGGHADTLFIKTLNAASQLRSAKGHQSHPGVGEPVVTVPFTLLKCISGSLASHATLPEPIPDEPKQ